ncbi:MAG: hypothetical protein ACREJO_00095 [Phycisphaerales bacterium]
MNRLDAKNQILAYCGEEPINDETSADYVNNKINVSFEPTRKEMLSHGFSFNTDEVTLSPDVNGQITVPGGTMKIRFPHGYDFLTVREGKVWDNSRQQYWSSSVRCLITQDIEFEKLPDVFAHWVMVETALKVYHSLNGVANPLILDDRRRAKARALNSEPSNIDNVSGWGRIVAAYGT